MAGIRILHDDLKSCIVTIEHPYIPLAPQDKCPTCGFPHTKKTYHLWLDGEGAAVVSPEVFQHLRAIGQGELPRQFRVESKVEKPPGATINMNGGRQPAVVFEKPRIRMFTNVGV